MKFSVITALLTLPNANAIYLACCKRESECPSDRKTMELADDTFKACCYENESLDPKETLDEMMTCLEPTGMEGGAKIALMSLPVDEQPIDSQVPELAPVDGNEVAVTLMATNTGAPEVPNVDGEGPTATTLIATPPEATNTTEEANSNIPVVTTTPSPVCCGAIAAAQQLRSGTQATVCPKNTFSVDGAMYEEGDFTYQVCCDAEGRVTGDFVDASLSPCVEATSQAPPSDAVNLVNGEGAANDKPQSDQVGDADPNTNSDSAAPVEATPIPDDNVVVGEDANADEDAKLLDDSSSASVMQNAAIVGIALVGAAVQAAV